MREKKIAIVSLIASGAILAGVLVSEIKGTRKRLKKCQADFEAAIKLAEDGKDLIQQANDLNADMRLWIHKTMEVCQPSPEQLREINEAFDMTKWEISFD